MYPEPFQKIIEIDRRLDEKVVQFSDIKLRRRYRRMCQIFVSQPQAPDGNGGGSPVVMAA